VSRAMGDDNEDACCGRAGHGACPFKGRAAQQGLAVALGKSGRKSVMSFDGTTERIACAL